MTLLLILGCLIFLLMAVADKNHKRPDAARRAAAAPDYEKLKAFADMIQGSQ